MSDDVSGGADLGPASPAPDTTSMHEGETIDAMVEWFFANFDNPAEDTPWDEGEYIWIWGGPYDAREELDDAFPGVNENLIEAAADRITQEGGHEWAPSSSRIIWKK